MYLTCCLYGAGRNDFDVGYIHFEGHWKGWALKIETFLSPEMATSEAYIEINSDMKSTLDRPPVHKNLIFFFISATCPVYLFDTR
jgi:hypothetical protein